MPTFTEDHYHWKIGQAFAAAMGNVIPWLMWNVAGGYTFTLSTGAIGSNRALIVQKDNNNVPGFINVYRHIITDWPDSEERNADQFIQAGFQSSYQLGSSGTAADGSVVTYTASEVADEYDELIGEFISAIYEEFGTGTVLASGSTRAALFGGNLISAIFKLETGDQSGAQLIQHRYEACTPPEGGGLSTLPEEAQSFPTEVYLAGSAGTAQLDRIATATEDISNMSVDVALNHGQAIYSVYGKTTNGGSSS